MKKRILLVFTALLTLALMSCEKKTEKLEINQKTNPTEVQSDQTLYNIQEKRNKTFEELKREAEIETLEAKERIKFSDEESNNTFEKLKKEAEQATQEAKERIKYGESN
jgi:flagellar biosynthesis component FlhA